MSRAPQQYEAAIFSQLTRNAEVLNTLTEGKQRGTDIDFHQAAMDAEMSQLQADVATLTLKVERIESKLVIMKWMVWAIALAVLFDLFRQPLWSALHLN